MLARPHRTDAHRQRDALIALFLKADLVPFVSCNGSMPEADIQTMTDVSFDADGTMKAPTKPGQLAQCWLTERGRARLDGAGLSSSDVAVDFNEARHDFRRKLADAIDP